MPLPISTIFPLAYEEIIIIIIIIIINNPRWKDACPCFVPFHLFCTDNKLNNLTETSNLYCPIFRLGPRIFIESLRRTTKIINTGSFVFKFRNGYFLNTSHMYYLLDIIPTIKKKLLIP
jgi:hypothetical protein